MIIKIISRRQNYNKKTITIRPNTTNISRYIK